MPRISIRQIMATVLLIAVIFWLGVPAVEVYRTKEYHVHVGVGSRNDEIVARSGVPAPFWSRYWKRLRGRTWLAQACDVRVGFERERCELPMKRW
jgi:hypothetical protein